MTAIVCLGEEKEKEVLLGKLRVSRAEADRNRVPGAAGPLLVAHNLILMFFC